MGLVEILLGFLACGLGFALLRARRRAKEENAAHGATVAEVSRLQQALKRSEAQLAELKKYEGVVDAALYASELRRDAQAKAEVLTSEAQREAASLLEKAHNERTAAQQASERERENARIERDRVLAHAKAEAERIAGEALDALKNKKHYDDAAQAMRNVVEGYGDRYLVPTYSSLDQLAEHFGYEDAGKSLKAARSLVRAMIANGTAAKCEYVEEGRRTTAIDFVLDAFNGKVDSILADVRHDNYGTLQQKVRDAFALVNLNGRAFREARITSEFLDARLDELRWAVAATELKLKEREEQRAIKERIREEERAQREFERAMKDAQKEEELLNKAMEKARRDLEKASDEQRSRYEAQLAQLAEKLRLAEEKNKRALSMAQQTRSGHVYVISNVGSFGEDVLKIGMTRRLEPLDRVRELGDASVPFEFDVHAMIESDDAPTLENALHKTFMERQVNKVNPRKEFFKIAVKDVRAELEKKGLTASWTMTAACREYRESLAIEKALAEKKIDREVWAKQQAAAGAAQPNDDQEEAA
jgi:hypothetical protein